MTAGDYKSVNPRRVCDNACLQDRLHMWKRMHSTWSIIILFDSSAPVYQALWATSAVFGGKEFNGVIAENVAILFRALSFLTYMMKNFTTRTAIERAHLAKKTNNDISKLKVILEQHLKTWQNAKS